MNEVKKSLNDISKKLVKIQDAREFLLKNSREVIVLCSKAIILTHSGKNDESKKILKNAENLLKKYRTKLSPEISRYLITAEQEFVEASCFISIIEKKPIPSQKKMNVMSESYVLGLMDCIGELKRTVFDKIRVGQVDEAIRIFEIMEELYMNLYPFSLYDKVVKEARKKMDVARILVEDVRVSITEEKRRSELLKTIEKLK
ncbi:MAG: RNA-binding protein [Nitrosopumilus sp.]